MRENTIPITTSINTTNIDNNKIAKQLNDNINHFVETNSIKTILPKNKKLYFKDMPLMVQLGLRLGPKCIYNYNMPHKKTIDLLNKKQSTQLDDNEQNVLTNALIKQPRQKNIINPKHLKTALDKYTDENNIIIQNADKNLCTVLIDKDIYSQHLQKLTTDNNNYKPIPVSTAIDLIARQYNVLYAIFYEFRKKWLFEYAVKEYKNFGIPNLYLIPKIHKPTLSFRPIVNQKHFIFSNIYKMIHTYYHQKLSKHNIKKELVLDGNHDFLTKINNMNNIIKNNNTNLQEYDLISLDIVNLYGNINLDDIITTLQKTCDFSNSDDNFYLRITKYIIKNNILEINNNTYIQQQGLGMGINYAPL